MFPLRLQNLNTERKCKTGKEDLDFGLFCSFGVVWLYTEGYWMTMIRRGGSCEYQMASGRAMKGVRGIGLGPQADAECNVLYFTPVCYTQLC